MLVQEQSVIDRQVLARRYDRVRGMSRLLCQTLTAEDCCIQSMTDASPTRWHLAHTTWFFETFMLAAHGSYRSRHPQYAYLFNSYYNSVGQQFPRSERGMLSRPTVAEVWEYREQIDEAVTALLMQMPEDRLAAVSEVLELGMQHEQQHQELMLTDIKHAFSKNPLAPVFREAKFSASSQSTENLRWCEFPGGIARIGHQGPGFAYDNESPRHRIFLEPYALAARLVTAGEYEQFIDDGGYERPELWLSEGWQHVQENQWQAPLYWRLGDEGWKEFTLAGLQPLDPQRPVCHVSYFEADAFARWQDARLATEAEWEAAAAQAGQPTDEDGFVDRLLSSGEPVHPRCVDGAANGPAQMFGDAWEWTSSAYAPYPGYTPAPGALGEYNGKFMCNQYVLRGGSCCSSSDHLRATYRNFFSAATRWQFSGIRLARGR